MDAAPIVLPPPIPAPRRPPLPLLAAAVPVVAGVMLWLLSGSVFALCFAILGPLMIAASLADGARTRRRELRRSRMQESEGWRRAEEELERAHREERERIRHRHPDAASCATRPPLRSAHGIDQSTELVVGRGSIPSSIRTSGGEGEQARSFQERTRVLTDAPVAVALGAGLCVRAPEPIAAAAVRALVIQLCLRFGPAHLALTGADLGRLGLGDLPHAGAAPRGVFTLAVVGSAGSESGGREDARVWMIAPDDDVPEGVVTLLDCVEPARATLRTPQGVAEVGIECLSLAQAQTIAKECADRAVAVDLIPDAVALHELRQPPKAPGLSAAIGRGERGHVVLDIVEDGPHAIVTGTTGTGKSELLISWVCAIAATYGPDEVIFVLADFKGGTAFEPLRELPQVVAVVTDLDEEGARRGVSSLTAELRRREGALAAAGARDVGGVDLPRLVVVVDEFAALVHEHPDLAAVFNDVAARGRALGMHLILGTQRAGGVIREALAANCPLRVSLRVSDSADSRQVIGTDAAAELPGGAASRGLGLARRPQDDEPVLLRVALTNAADLRAIGMRWADAATPASPWLPTLPAMLPLSELRAGARRSAGAVVLGRADDPDRQRQPREVLRPGVDRGLAILGGPGAGKSAALRMLAAQYPAALRIPRDLETAWDLSAALVAQPSTSAALLLCDDIDLLFSEFPTEYAQQMVQLWERLLRTGGPRTVVVTAARWTGAVSRLLEALPARALLRMTSRVEHVAAGGEPSTFRPDRPAGRARIGDREVQLAWIPEDQDISVHTDPAVMQDPWMPSAPCTGIVSSGAGAAVGPLRDAYPTHDVVLASQAPQPSHRPSIVLGDAESWQRQWALWQRVRTDGEVLVRAECASDLRQLAGIRELPPYARLHGGRAWSVREGRRVERVVIPALSAT